jgi:hypothetical protein
MTAWDKIAGIATTVTGLIVGQAQAQLNSNPDAVAPVTGPQQTLIEKIIPDLNPHKAVTIYNIMSDELTGGKIQKKRHGTVRVDYEDKNNDGITTDDIKRIQVTEFLEDGKRVTHSLLKTQTGLSYAKIAGETQNFRSRHDFLNGPRRTEMITDLVKDGALDVFNLAVQAVWQTKNNPGLAKQTSYFKVNENAKIKL